MLTAVRQVHLQKNNSETSTTGDEDITRSYITKGLYSGDKSMINAELLNKALVQQLPPTPPATTALWKPRHLYKDQENDEIWTDVNDKSSTSKAKRTSIRRSREDEINKHRRRPEEFRQTAKT